jgi:hypothetical protein
MVLVELSNAQTKRTIKFTSGMDNNNKITIQSPTLGMFTGGTSEVDIPSVGDAREDTLCLNTWLLQLGHLTASLEILLPQLGQEIIAI